MDFLVLKTLVDEQRQRLVGQKVRAFQSAGRLGLFMEPSDGHTLLLSADAVRPGLFPITMDGEKNTSGLPPRREGNGQAFAAQVAKRLVGTVVRDLSLPQPGERIVHIVFAHGWPAKREMASTLVCEFMGRHSNLILVDEERRVRGALKIVTSSQSRVRPVIPGEVFRDLPPRNGVPVDRIASGGIDPLTGNDPEGLMAQVRGLSPWTARQLLALSAEKGPRHHAETIESILRPTGRGYLTVSGDRLYLSAFRPVPLEQSDEVQVFDSLAAAAVEWYSRRPGTDQAAFSSNRNLLRRQLEERLFRQQKLFAQLEDEEARNLGFVEVRRMGEALLADFTSVERGQSLIEKPDPYDPETVLSIKLDPRKTPHENVEAYFERARRMERGLEEIAARKRETKRAVKALEEAMSALNEGEEGPATALLEKEGVRASHKSEKPATYRGPGRRYTREGFTILVGKNAADNERVTFGAAGNHDLWLHTRDYAGSHVVIITGGNEVPEEIIRYAASLAADSSQARGDPTIDVMVTERKWVRKLKGGKPGQVTVERYRTVRPLRSD